MRGPDACRRSDEGGFVTYDDRGHSALPKLYGAPAYSRPPTAASTGASRPLSTDDLPIEAERTEEDLAVLQEALMSRGASAITGSSSADGTSDSARRSGTRPFRLGAIGSLIRGRTDGPQDAGR
jgi:hypothetical protein